MAEHLASRDLSHTAGSALDCWGRPAVVRTTKIGRWHDRRRCEVCGLQSLQRLCLECGERLAEQGATDE